jgi:hypothetical protein
LEERDDQKSGLGLHRDLDHSWMLHCVSGAEIAAVAERRARTRGEALMLGFSPLALVVALIAVVIVVLLLSYLWSPDRKRDWTSCPECQKAIQKGRRYCPFCNAEVIKYDG